MFMQSFTNINRNKSLHSYLSSFGPSVRERHFRIDRDDEGKNGEMEEARETDSSIFW